MGEMTMKSGLFLLMALCLFALPAAAQDETPDTSAAPAAESAEAPKTEDKKPDEKKAEEPAAKTESRYAPDFCDFEITFPEEPYKNKRCPDGGAACYDIMSYTMVYDFKTTVDISVNCIPSTPENFARYDETTMRTALQGMATRNNIKDPNINYGERDGVRQASLSGAGKAGKQDKIFTSQLWVGPNSIFTVQAELIGAAHDKADKGFTDILKSIKTKPGKQLPQPAAPVAPAPGN